MSDNSNHMQNSGANIWLDVKRDDINSVTPAIGEGHMHLACNSQGNLHHADWTLDSGTKVNVNPDVAQSLAPFLRDR